MAPAGAEFERRALAAQLVQQLAEPAHAILGYQELVLEEAREGGPAEALPDLERVMEAARRLSALVDDLAADRLPDPGDAGLEARLRHDLRTPMNAVLGYTEMVLEEFGSALSTALAEDVARVATEARRLLAQIDGIEDLARRGGSAPGPPGERAHTVAAELARTLAARPTAPQSRRGRILVVDDSASNRDLLTRRLARLGHDATAASSGVEALERLRSGAFDLALLDILMPDMNGVELLRRIMADPALREMPVLMVSGLHDDEAVVGCIAAGAADYLPKPVDPVLLRARIDASLERARWRERERRYLASIEFEKRRADALLDAMLPAEVIRRLSRGETAIADRFDDVTIVFADIVGFSGLAANAAPGALVRRLGALFSRFDELADLRGVEKIKTIGDAYMAAAGVPEPRPDHARAAVAFARDILAEARRAGGDGALDLRIGVHSGPVVAGLIGRKRFVYDLWGHTVNVASRLESHGAPGRIQISQATLDGLAGEEPVLPQGELPLRGVGPTTAYLLQE